MKKIMLTLMVLGAASTLFAQSHYYGLSRDTIRDVTPIYMYQWDWHDHVHPIGEGLVNPPADSHFYSSKGVYGYMRFFTDTPVRIVGVAFCFQILNLYSHSPYWNTEVFDPTGPQYLRLFDATSNGPVELASVCWSDDYATHPRRYMEIEEGVFSASNWGCNTILYERRYLPTLEYYFDSAITVTDSFYVGSTFDLYYPKPMPDEGGDAADYLMFLSEHTFWPFGIKQPRIVYPDSPHPDDICTVQIPPAHYIGISSNNTVSYSIVQDMINLVFPIIEIDTVGLPYDTARFECHIPDSLVLNRRFRNAATMEWVEQADNSVVQLSVTAPGGDPDSGNLITARTHDYHTFTGIDPDSAYEVYARAWCDYSQMWSAWTEPVYVGAFNGIDGPEEGPEFSLAPNPAHSSVTLTVGQPLDDATVTLLDLQGRTLRMLPLRGDTLTVPLQGLPPATYILRLDTPQGSSSRKLTVE